MRTMVWMRRLGWPLVYTGGSDFPSVAARMRYNTAN